MKTIDEFLEERCRNYQEKQHQYESSAEFYSLVERLTEEKKQLGYTTVPDLAEPSPGSISVHFHGFPHSAPYRELFQVFHRHQYYELVYVYRGQMRNRFPNGQQILLRQGDLLLLNSNALHGVDTDGMGDLVFDIIISPRLFEQYALSILRDNPLFSFFFLDDLYSSKKSERYLYFKTDRSAKARELIESIITESLNDLPCRDNMMQAALMMLFAELSRMQTAARHLPLHRDDKNMKLFEMITYIEEHCDHLTLDCLAEKFHYSTSYLSKQIYQATGKHFCDLLQDSKLNRAIQQLEHTPLSVGEIARISGFKDESYFHRIFKAKYGVTPRAWRKQH